MRVAEALRLFELTEQSHYLSGSTLPRDQPGKQDHYRRIAAAKNADSKDQSAMSFLQFARWRGGNRPFETAEERFIIGF
jgi:hypothetical protein